MKYYVYELWDSLKNEPFYVGKGKIIGVMGFTAVHFKVMKYC
jgi:hypothetical protein